MRPQQKQRVKVTVQPFFIGKQNVPVPVFWWKQETDLEKQALGEPVPLRAVCLRAGSCALYKWLTCYGLRNCFRSGHGLLDFLQENQAV